MTEARIRTQFGDIRITYKTSDELQEILLSIESQIQQIQAIAIKIAPPIPRLPKPGFEYAYRFLPTGQVELLSFPDAKSKIVALALFAYSPEFVAVEEIEQITGVENVVDSVLSQTLNKKYFRRTDAGYGLTMDGIKLVLSSVPPRSQTEEDPEI